MKEIEAEHISEDKVPTLNTYPLYEYPDYTFDKKYDNDEYQKAVIAIDNGYHLVLAPPGCGKTDILAERVARAVSTGVDVSDMLCLTFTNRAARGMRSRISERLAVSGELNLFVGNVHRFCSHFLFDNNLVAKSTTIIEANDSREIIGHIITEDSFASACEDESGYEKYLEDISKLQHILALSSSGCSKDKLPDLDLFRRHPFGAALRGAGMEFTFENLNGLYDNEINIEEESARGYIFNMIDAAKRYDTYKRENNLLDFEDLLTETYILASQNPDAFKKYKWIQIDEVQDLSPFQFAIIDLFTDSSGNTVTLYLGDEQQAIFSFIGAKLATLEWLRARCGTNMHRLYNNYRSPKYLLDIYNNYANMQLDVDPCFLPRTNNVVLPENDALAIIPSEDKSAEIKKVGEMVIELLAKHPNDKTAVLVPWNSDANKISGYLRSLDIPHFKISGDDVFTTPEMQFLLAHFQLMYNDANIMAWSRVLTQLGIYSKMTEATDALRKMRNNCLVPADYFREDGETYMSELAACCKGKYVIFDTETTGLNVLEDDIVQIAAIKIQNGSIIGSFNVIMHTDKDIPEKLGDIVNPLIEEYAKSEPCERSKGLVQFLDFCESLPILGHNVEYDYNILDNNLKRDCKDYTFKEQHPVYFDTLKAARIVQPSLKKYRLKYLLEYFNLEGENSHLADDDIIATKSVLDYCISLFETKRTAHFSVFKELKEKGELLSEKYRDIYYRTKNKMYVHSPCDDPTLLSELDSLYDFSLSQGWINKIEKFPYIMNYFKEDAFCWSKTPYLRSQLESFLIDMTTLREADLCESSSIGEKVFVSTVHKAKGLEFENVIVFEATDGVYPHFARTDSEDIKESARLFYVGLSRSKKRLYITYCTSVSGVSRYGNYYCREKFPTPFLKHIKKYFDKVKE